MQTPEEWRQRFSQQAGWTAEARRYLFQRLRLEDAGRVLEVGCGPGVVTADLHGFTRAAVHGLDLRLDFLRLAHSADRPTRFTCGDALALPYADGAFDLTLCHFLLLWLKDPLRGLAEMRRVTRPGGYVAALAEPDYHGRIDYPETLSHLGALQARSLQAQGADPGIGRRLLALFQGAGLRRAQMGLLGGQWGAPIDPAALQSEWAVMTADLGGRLPAGELERLRRLDEQAWQQGVRVLFVPTFYAWGRV